MESSDVDNESIKIELIPLDYINSLKKNKIQTKKYNAENADYVMNAFSIRNQTVEIFLESIKSTEYFSYTLQKCWICELISEWLTEIKTSELFHHYEFFVIVLWFIRLYDFLKNNEEKFDDIDDFFVLFELKNSDLYTQFVVFGWDCLIDETSVEAALLREMEGEDEGEGPDGFEVASVFSQESSVIKKKGRRNSRSSIRKSLEQGDSVDITSTHTRSLPDASSITTFFENNSYKFDRQIEFLMLLTRECLYSNFRFALFQQVVRFEYHWKLFKLKRPIFKLPTYFPVSVVTALPVRKTVKKTTRSLSSIKSRRSAGKGADESYILPLIQAVDINEQFWEKLMLEATLNELYYNIFKTDSSTELAK